MQQIIQDGDEVRVVPQPRHATSSPTQAPTRHCTVQRPHHWATSALLGWGQSVPISMRASTIILIGSKKNVGCWILCPVRTAACTMPVDACRDTLYHRSRRHLNCRANKNEWPQQKRQYRRCRIGLEGGRARRYLATPTSYGCGRLSEFLRETSVSRRLPRAKW